jgi:serine/threonine protein kinase
MEIDTIVDGRYRIVDIIGRGGMGAVYKAVDIPLKRYVAIKHLHRTTESADHKRNLADVEREAQILAALRHEGLPQVINHFTADDSHYLVMEFIDGDNLFERLARANKQLPFDEVMGWAGQLLDVLQYLHSRTPPVIHRDIKPHNIKLNSAGKIVLLDFGVAKGTPQINTSHSEGTRPAIGYTLQYAPLEQTQRGYADAQSDLYAFAATIYHLLCGTPPVDSLSRAAQLVSDKSDPLRPLREYNPEIPVPVEKVLLQALAIAPEQRPASAAELRTLLKQAQDPGQVTAPLPARRSPARRVVAAIRRRPKRSVALFSLLALIPILLIVTRPKDNQALSGVPTAEPTATAVPTLDPTQVMERAAAAELVRSEASAWTVSFSDTFDGPDTRWPLTPDIDPYAHVEAELVDGKYRLSVTALQDQGAVGWIPKPPTPYFSDFYLTVDVERVQGPSDSGAGILYRMDDQNQFYIYRIIPSEQAFATIYQPQAPPTILIPRTISASIRRDNVNRLAIIARGTHFWFFINETYVADVEDASLAQGKINFVVRLPRADQAIYDFDNLEIRVPSK